MPAPIVIFTIGSSLMGTPRRSRCFFAAALGFYPQINIKDAAFCVLCDGVQYNLRASAHLHMERMNLDVGPISAKVLVALTQIGLKVEDNDQGISADLEFTGLCDLIEEPRFVHRVGPRVQFDYTRMTQNGCWRGWIQVRGKRFVLAADDVIGTRDRSWGVRPIGARDTQPLVDADAPQFYWLWAPVHGEDKTLLFAVNEFASGDRWHTNALAMPHQIGAGDEQLRRYSHLVLDFEMESGTRYQQNTRVKMGDPEANDFLELEMKPKYRFYMSGLGYMHPEWGHGTHHGDLAIGYDEIDVRAIDPKDPLFWHVQSVSQVTYSDGGDERRQGFGVLEQIIIGAHHPSGLQSPTAMAP